MTWITVAVIGGSTLVGAGTTIWAGNQQSRATGDAAKRSDATTRYMFDTARGDLAPFRNTAYSALDDLATLYGWASPSASAAGGAWPAGGGTVSGGTRSGGSLPGALNPLNALPGGSLSPLGVFGHKDPLSKAIGGLFGGNKAWTYRQNDAGMIEFNGKNSGKDQLGGYINPQTGQVFLTHDPYGGSAERLTEYLRTGQGELPKYASRFGQAVNAMRGAGWTYKQPQAETAGGAVGDGAPRQPSMERFFTSPDYTYRYEQGLKGLQNLYAAQGRGFSGPAAAGIMQRGADIGSGAFNDYRNSLLAAAGLTQTSVSQGANLAASTGSNLANIYMNEGAQRASTYGQTAQGINNALQGGLGNWLFYDAMKKGYFA